MSKHLEQHVAATMRAGESVLVALSGGADSVALLVALTRLGHRCVALHCNYGLRGDESDRDENHARAIAAKLSVPIEVIRCDVPAYKATHPGESVEMICRAMRYKAFSEAKGRHGLDVIAIGHHLEDNIETMMLNMLRGSGLKGLAAMKPRRGDIVRPLLQCTKNDILQYLESLDTPYVTDSSNLTNDYRRNAIRNEILPLIQRYFPDAVSGLSNTLSALGSQRALLTDYVDSLSAGYINADHSISVKRLTAEERHPENVLFEILNAPDYRGYTTTVVRNIIRHASDSGLTFTGTDGSGYLLDHGMLVPLDHCQEVEEDIVIDLDNMSAIDRLISCEIITREGFRPERDPATAYFDLDKLRQYKRIVLRHPQAGDRLQPWGMKGSRAISDIFTDMHATRQQRRSTYVMDADGQILWLVGIRASRHATVTPTSRLILKLTAR